VYGEHTKTLLEGHFPIYEAGRKQTIKGTPTGFLP